MRTEKYGNQYSNKSNPENPVFWGIDVEVSRQLADLKRLDPMKIFYKKMDLQVYNGDYEVPIRVFFPDEASCL